MQSQVLEVLQDGLILLHGVSQVHGDVLDWLLLLRCGVLLLEDRWLLQIRVYIDELVSTVTVSV